MVLKMTISKAWAMDFVWSSVGNFLLYAKFSLSGGIQHGVLNIRYVQCFFWFGCGLVRRHVCVCVCMYGPPTHQRHHRLRKKKTPKPKALSCVCDGPTITDCEKKENEKHHCGNIHALIHGNKTKERKKQKNRERKKKSMRDICSITTNVP